MTALGRQLLSPIRLGARREAHQHIEAIATLGPSRVHLRELLATALTIAV